VLVQVKHGLGAGGRLRDEAAHVEIFLNKRVVDLLGIEPPLQADHEQPQGGHAEQQGNQESGSGHFHQDPDIVLVQPGFVNVITPAQAHMHWHVCVSAGMPRINGLGDEGIHGAGMTGTHGIGVRTPSAAAVAAATSGLANELHIPKGGMLAMGTLSAMLAAGGPSPRTVGTRTTSDDGANPKVHCIIAPIFT